MPLLRQHKYEKCSTPNCRQFQHNIRKIDDETPFLCCDHKTKLEFDETGQYYTLCGYLQMYENEKWIKYLFALVDRVLLAYPGPTGNEPMV